MEKKPEVLTEEARKARAEYKRKWRRENPDKCREYHIRHWNKVAKQTNRGVDHGGEENKTEE